jgi:hypothetical protein
MVRKQTACGCSECLHMCNKRMALQPLGANARRDVGAGQPTASIASLAVLASNPDGSCDRREINNTPKIVPTHLGSGISAVNGRLARETCVYTNYSVARIVVNRIVRNTFIHKT